MDMDRFRHHLAGPVASINTPFLENDDIDYDGLRRFVDFCIEAGAGTVLFTPGDSLYSVLTEAEVAELTAFTVDVVNKRALFIASAGFWSTPQTAAFAEYARDHGADAVIVAPPDRGMTVDGLVTYYDAVSQALPAFILSAGLVSVGVRGALETVDRLLNEVPGVVGFKEDFGPDFARGACARAHGKWVIFAGGQKQTHMDMLPYGCDGYMSTFIKFKPDVAHGYWAAIERGDLDGAADVITRYDMPFFDYLYNTFPAGGDAAQHAVLELAGICGRWRRSPLPDLSDAEMEQLKVFLTDGDML
ncbi:MAG: dihydrodipicolinate synthase family protein [Gemmatimonadetes bacterium]|nr:dihydrodipicolinate synthase family protein [Gemmatimonadota bacterium]